MKTFLKRDAHQQASAASAGTRQFADNRAEAVAQRRQQQLMESSEKPAQLQAAQDAVVQREDGDEWDIDKIQGRERSNAVTERPPGMPGRLDTSKMEAMLAPRGGGPSPLDAAAVAAIPEEGILSKIKRKILGDKRSPAEKAAASAQENIANRAKANQVGLLGNTVAKYMPGVDSQQALAAAAGQKGIAHENAEAHKKINQSLAFKGGGMAMSGVAAATSLIPVDPVSQSLIKGAVKLGGAGLNHAGAAREGLSGGMLSDQAASREHGLMTMALASEGVARSENATMGKQQAKSDGVKALIPGAPVLGALGVDEAIAKGASSIAGTVAGKVLDPSDAQKAKVKGLQADAQVTKERLGNQAISGVSKSLSPEENARIKQQQAIMRDTQAGRLARFGIGQQAAVDRLKPAEQRAAPAPVEAVETELQRKLRLQREKLAGQG